MCFVRITVSSWILLYFIFVIGDPSLGSIRSYSDSSCLKQVNKTQGVVAGACVNTDSVVAVAADSLPSCGRTTAILYISDIANCMEPSFLPIVSSGNVGDCLSFIEGRPIDSAHFQCKNSTDEMGNTPDNTTSGPPDDPPEGGGPSLGMILGLLFGLVSAIGSVIGVVMRLPRQDLSNSQGSLMLFTDECCHDPISESSVPLISGDCQGAPFSGIKGVVLTSLPTCPDYGLPLLIVSNETSCRNPQSESTANSGVIGKCQSFLITEISSFQFICYGKGVSSVPPPSTTTSSQMQSTQYTITLPQSEIQETPTSTDLDGTQSETHWTPTSTNWDETQSETWWTPTSSKTWWTPTSSKTWWMPTSSTTWWTPTSTSGWGGTYEAGPTLTLIPIERETRDSDADGRSWFTLTVTMNNTVYEVRQPTVEYGLVKEESLSCNSSNTVSHRKGAPVLVCLVTFWLLISLSLS